MKKVIATILLAALLISLLSACSSTQTSSNAPQSATLTQPATEPAIASKLGSWTASDYTNQWLNMSYDCPDYWTTADIEISKEFDNLKLANDPYYGLTAMKFQHATVTSSYTLLTIERMKNIYKTAKSYAADDQKAKEDLYKTLGANYRLYKDKEVNIRFLGETYFVHYTYEFVNGSQLQECRLYLVKDGYLATLMHTDEGFSAGLRYALDNFTALDGNDYKNSCSRCGWDVNYEVVSAAKPMCLDCYFATH